MNDLYRRSREARCLIRSDARGRVLVPSNQREALTHSPLGQQAGLIHAPGLPKVMPQMCGYYGDPKRQCRCSVKQIETYRQRISGPLLDRIDLHVEVPLVDFRELSSTATTSESSAVIRERVRLARAIQSKRFKNKPLTNSAMGPRFVRDHCKLDSEGAGYLEHSMEQMNFSARAHDRILKVARTLADLGGSDDIRPNDILEAIQYRTLDRNLFA